MAFKTLVGYGDGVALRMRRLDDPTKKIEFSVGATGNLTITPVGGGTTVTGTLVVTGASTLTGNVGIGTAASVQTLSVVTPQGADKTMILVGIAGLSNGLIANYVHATTSIEYTFSGPGSASSLTVAPPATFSSTLAVTGAVRLGTSALSAHANADDLVIEGTGAQGLTIFSGAATAGSVYFGDSGSSTSGGVEYAHGTDTLRLIAANGYRLAASSTGVAVTGTLTVNTTGDVVGIDLNATSTVTNALDIRGTAFTTGSAILVQDNSPDTGTRDTVFIVTDHVSATGATTLHLRNDSTGKALWVEAGTALFAGAVTMAAALTQTGGATFINTAATPVRLHVDGGTGDYVNLYADTAVAYKTLKLQGTGTGIVEVYNGLSVYANAILTSADLGAATGRKLTLGNNTNASTPAAGHIVFTARDATGYRVWVDNTGVARIWAAGEPTFANDTSGTVIGTQTSDARLKKGITDWDGAGALASIVELRPNLKAFRYRNNSLYGDRVLHGLVIEEADRGKWWTANIDHDKATFALNEIEMWGRTFASFGEVDDRLVRCESREDRLKAALKMVLELNPNIEGRNTVLASLEA